MNESLPVPTEQPLANFAEIQQVAYAKEGVAGAGAKHVYGVTEDGKKQHLSHEEVLGAYGYEDRATEQKKLDAAEEVQQVHDFLGTRTVKKIAKLDARQDRSADRQSDLAEYIDGYEPKGLHEFGARAKVSKVEQRARRVSSSVRERRRSRLSDKLDKVMGVETAADTEPITDPSKEGLRTRFSKRFMKEGSKLEKLRNKAQERKAAREAREPKEHINSFTIKDIKQIGRGAVEAAKTGYAKAGVAASSVGRKTGQGVAKTKEFYNDDEKGTRRKIITGTIAAAAVVATTVIAVRTGMNHGIDLNPFDGDGIDLNGHSGSDHNVGEHIGAKSTASPQQVFEAKYNSMNPQQQRAFGNLSDWVDTHAAAIRVEQPGISDAALQHQLDAAWNATWENTQNV